MDHTYHLGARGVSYAPKVWNYPQSTNWTNKNTYAQWYMQEFQKDKNVNSRKCTKTSERINEVI